MILYCYNHKIGRSLKRNKNCTKSISLKFLSIFLDFLFDVTFSKCSVVGNLKVRTNCLLLNNKLTRLIDCSLIILKEINDEDAAATDDDDDDDSF